MSNIKLHGFVAVAAVGLLTSLAATDAGADERDGFRFGRFGPTTCDATATGMLKACFYDVGDDLHTTLANCDNLADRSARNGCRRDAYAARRDQTKECHAVFSSRRDACELLGENRYDPDPLTDPALIFIDPDDVGTIHAANPYVSLVAGHTYVLRAGDDWEETVIVHVTEETRDILDVACRVVVDIVVETDDEGGEIGYDAVEVTDDWFAQTTSGDVYYCGELARNFEDGLLRDLDGSFEAGREFAKAGLLARAAPLGGEADRQEFALGEAEDIIEYLDVATAPGADEGGDNPAFPCGMNGCVKTREFTPIEPDGSEYKYYKAGIGFVLGVGLEDGEVTGDRDELVCVGDSLDVLGDPSCGIADPEALLEELCGLAPATFCLAEED